MTSSESLVGKVVGNYEILRELGRGGMGVVYKAHEQSLQRVVALKVLAKHLAHDETFIKRFLREARAAAQLTHPNIVTVHAVGDQDGVYYIAMEYVKGQSLAQYIRREGQVDVRQALRITQQVAGALAQAHTQGIIHRDIKPANIMLDQAGRAKVMDFGLAKVLHAQTELTAEGAKLGSPRYMSPEQVGGEPLDARTDIYSLGVTLYEMLAGRTPFEADTPLAIMYQITQQPFPPVGESNSDVPPSVAGLIAKMTAKKPDDRHGSAQDLRVDLASCLHEPPASRRRATAPAGIAWHGIKQAVSKVRPGRQSALIAGSLALALILALVVSRWLREPSEAEWTSLFNGLDLTGWQNAQNPGAENKWSLEDGTLTNTEHGTDIATVGQWKDFELELQYKLAPNGNSGVYLRGRIEVQMLDSYGKSSNGTGDDGAIWGQFAPKMNASRPAGQWNTLYVRYIGDLLTVKLNGKSVHVNQKITHVTDGALAGDVNDLGPLMFQGSHGKVWFRNIKVRRAAATPRRFLGAFELGKGRPSTGLVQEPAPVAKSPKDQIGHAQQLAIQGKYREAIQAFEEVRAEDPHAIESFHGLQCAAVYAALGDRAGHERLCRWMFNQFPLPQRVEDAERTAKAYILYPGVDDEELLEQAARMTKHAVDNGTGGFLHWFNVSHGMAEYHLKRYREASKWLDKELRNEETLIQSLALAYSAMAEYARGNESRAREVLIDARAAAAKLPQPGTEDYRNRWADVLTSKLALGEAEKLIDSSVKQ